MKMRKSIVIIAAVCAVFAFAGMAMAQNRVEVKVTSEPIGYQAVCDKAGNFSLEFDTNTTISVGDQIVIDLPFKTPSVNTTICKKIDFEVSDGGSASAVAANKYVLADVGLDGTEPFYFVEDGATAADFADVGAGGIYFRVKGNVNTQRITIDVLGTAGAGITVGGDPGDKLILVILDQADYTDATDWLWVDDNADGTYNNAADEGDNTLCINVEDWDESTVDASMDSSLDKYTFIPSNPEVAHIAAASSLAFAQCSKTDLNRTLCGTHGSFQGPDDTCISFDFETADGYVNGSVDTNRVIITNSSPYLLVNYQIKLEILVNGIVSDAGGVFWANSPILADGYDAVTGANSACEEDELANVVGAQANYVYRNATGAVTGAAAPRGDGTEDCDVAVGSRAVSVLTDIDSLDLDNDSSDDVLLIDIPYMNYDIDDITADDVVSVRVTLIKAPCGTIFEDEIDVAILCPETVVQELSANTVVYPYFTAMASDNWWDGLVITNLSAVEGNFTALIYEQDGDVGAFTGVIDANSLYQGTLANALAGAEQVAGSGDLGDSLCYILVCTDFTADGFAFMGSLSTNSLMANESMGYVPRVDYYNSNDSLVFCDNLQVVPGEIPGL